MLPPKRHLNGQPYIVLKILQHFYLWSSFFIQLADLLNIQVLHFRAVNRNIINNYSVADENYWEIPEIVGNQQYKSNQKLEVIQIPFMGCFILYCLGYFIFFLVFINNFHKSGAL